jgi:hypothetical protein
MTFHASFTWWLVSVLAAWANGASFMFLWMRHRRRAAAQAMRNRAHP